MSGAFRFETFVDTHSNIFNEYLSSVIANLSKKMKNTKTFRIRLRACISNIRKC